MFIAVVSTVISQKVENPEYKSFLNNSQRLYDALFSTYTKELSPILTRKEEVPINTSNDTRFNVNISLYFVKLVDVTEEEEKFSTLSEIFMTWIDPRLKWNPSDYGGLQELHVNADSVWQPENSLSDTSDIQEIYPPDIKTVIIKPEGTVSILRKIYAESTCKMTNIGHFPFDRETCSLYFMVYSYNYWDVKMTLAIPQPNIVNFAGNSEWDVEQITYGISFYNDSSYAYDFDSGAFNLVLRRQPHFYIYVIVLPCFTLCILSAIGMFWSSNRREDQLAKLSIGLTSLMSIAVLLQIVTDSIPKSQTFPLLGFYAIVSVFMIALGCAVLVSLPISTESTKKSIEAGSAVRRFLYRLTYPHVILHILFQLGNIINLIVFFSYWR
ncbi:unnamed protein product, partial [Mesorhabditis spiculigera]